MCHLVLCLHPCRCLFGVVVLKPSVRVGDLGAEIYVCCVNSLCFGVLYLLSVARKIGGCADAQE